MDKREKTKLKCLHEKRIKGLRKNLSNKGLDCLIVTCPSNIMYISGFRAEAGAAVVTEKECCLFVPEMLYEQAGEASDGFEIIKVKSELSGSIKRAFKGKGIRNAGFESESAGYAAYRKLRGDMFSKKLLPAGGVIEAQRVIKDSAEIAHIEKAVSISRKAIARAKKMLKPGIRENEVAAEIDFWVRSFPGITAGFETIVASGPNSAFPHHVTSGRKFRKGDAVMIDSGCRCCGYNSDLTRTFFLDKINCLTLLKVYNKVEQALKEAIRAVKPGVECRELFRRAKDVLNDCGLGNYFVHGLGHGVGLDVHEKPYMDSKNDEVLMPGMVVTVEPGVYIKGTGGVRIEEMVLVTDNGHRVL